MVAQGVKGLIVIAEDGDAAVTSVDKAADAGVKVIAYDRLIKTQTLLPICPLTMLKLDARKPSV